MGITEVLIIYLAIGTPIGVYAIVRPKNLLKQNLVALFAANILFWPIFASLEFVPRTGTPLEPRYFIDGRPNPVIALDQPRSTFKDRLNELGDRTFRRIALEDFDRLAALSNALHFEVAVNKASVPEVFELAGNPNPGRAAKCLFRKNNAKLLDHLQRAENDMGSLALELMSRDRRHFQTAVRYALHDLKIDSNSRTAT